jgi:hypothetical protein
MAKEYIEKEAVLKKQRALTEYDEFCRYAKVAVVEVDEIKDIPTADVVEVVRCKDCRNGRPIDKTRCPEKYFLDDCVVCECESVVGDEPMIYRPTHFCSYGERRDNDAAD